MQNYVTREVATQVDSKIKNDNPEDWVLLLQITPEITPFNLLTSSYAGYIYFMIPKDSLQLGKFDSVRLLGQDT